MEGGMEEGCTTCTESCRKNTMKNGSRQQGNNLESNKETPGLSKKKARRLHKKFLLALVTIVLLLALAFTLSYLLLVERQKTNKEQKSQKNVVCTDHKCVLNAADLLRKMDPSIDPCEDFYSYACGGYEKSTSIPPNLKSIHVLRQQQEENTKFLKTLIENPKIRTHYSQNKSVTKVFHMYDTCMDVDMLERVGISPFMELMNDLGGSNVTSKHWSTKGYNVLDAITQTKRRLNMDIFFRIGVWINPKDSSMPVFFISTTQLGMRPSSYLPHNTPEDDRLRHLYKEYMVNMMNSIGLRHNYIETLMEDVYKLERRIAKIYHRFPSNKSTPTIRELSNYTKFDWLSFFVKLTADINYTPTNNDIVLVHSQQILKHTMSVLKNTEKHILSNFIAWKIFREIIPALPTNYKRIQQRYLNSIQSRATEELPRWKRCVQLISEALKMALNYLYVDQAFSEESRKRAFEIFYEIRKEFIGNLPSKRWMDSFTRREAKEKAEAVNFLVGYNNDLKNSQKLEERYNELRVNRTNFFQTYLNQRSFQFKSNVKKLLSPVQKNSFEGMTSAANAYYSRQENKISFMAGILQRPFYDRHNSRASNYGSLGMFVGHELTHAFDSNGHKYDKNGKLRNWWTKFSLQNFHKKTKCFIQQYDKFMIFGEWVRGKNTLGENIADIGGLKLAYKAFKRNERENGNERRLPGLNLTNDQVFFLSFAQSWCSKYTRDGVKETINRRVPMMFRVTGTLRNSVEFSEAYHCPLDAKMNSRTKCTIW